jgi:hypothetical protein
MLIDPELESMILTFKSYSTSRLYAYATPRRDSLETDNVPSVERPAYP